VNGPRAAEGTRLPWCAMSSNVFVTVTGHDRPGVTSALFDRLDGLDVDVLDVEQVVVRDELLLAVLVDAGGIDADVVEIALETLGQQLGVTVGVRHLDTAEPAAVDRHHVTVLTEESAARAMAAVSRAVAQCGANIERIERLAAYPVAAYELLVAGGDATALRDALAAAAADAAVDVAVQRAGLYRRAKRLVVLDVDSTLIQGEVIEMLAGHAGYGAEVAEVTAAAMRGDIDFAESLRRRVALLEGLDADVFDRVREDIALTPGARTLVRTLKRLGYVVGVVSGGFTQVISGLVAELALDFAAANTLEVVDGRLTGRVVGPVVDRLGKAEALRRFADQAGVPLAQTVAIGDGANDLDMLAAAGLGVAFNAKPVVRAAADAALNVPYLDAILFLMGITREEVEAADLEDELAR
jgi:phosphoserine phosphatase